MKIPKKVKVGAKVYKVELTDQLYMGAQNYGGEIFYTGLEIHVLNTLAPKMQEHFFLHELVHAIADHLGYSDHDEKVVEAVTNALHMVIIDNPEIFKEEAKC